MKDRSGSVYSLKTLSVFLYIIVGQHITIHVHQKVCIGPICESTVAFSRSVSTRHAAKQ